MLIENENPEANLTLDEIVQNMSDAFVYIDEFWRYQFANKGALSLMNKEMDQIIGKTIWEVLPETIGTLFEKNYRKVMLERIPVSFEIFYAASAKWLEVRAYPHASGISIFYSDITEKKKAHEIVEASEKWFHNISDNSPVMVWSANTNKDFNFVNKTWLLFNGHKLTDELGENWVGNIHIADRKRVFELYSNSFDKRIEFRTECRMLFRDGSYRWVSCSGKPLYALDETFLGYGGTCVDIDEQVMVYHELEKKVAERTIELSQILEKEKEMNVQKSRFVSFASHEFRTPLSTILTSLGLIEQYHNLNESDQMIRHISRIRSSIRHMVNILNDFLSVDKLEQGNIMVDKQFFNMDNCLKETIEEISPLLKPDQDILCNYSGPRSVYSDRQIIHNIVLNLLSNAIKYSDKEIWIKGTVNNDEINISITDRGIGIPEQDQKLLFNKYFRASNVSNIQGTGLGLNIVQRYVALLDGNISVKSTEGEGTKFSISLPQSSG